MLQESLEKIRCLQMPSGVSWSRRDSNLCSWLICTGELSKSEVAVSRPWFIGDLPQLTFQIVSRPLVFYCFVSPAPLATLRPAFLKLPISLSLNSPRSFLSLSEPAFPTIHLLLLSFFYSLVSVFIVQVFKV